MTNDAQLQAALRQMAVDNARLQSAHSPREVRGPDVLPVPVLEGLQAFSKWCARQLSIDVPVTRFYEPRPIDEHTGLYWKDRHDEIWVATGRPAREMAQTIAHEQLHVSGVEDERECVERAAALVLQFERESVAELVPTHQKPHSQFFGGF